MTTEIDELVGGSTPSEHTRISPSKLQALATCPKWEARLRDVEEEEDEFDPANVGTRIHEAVEKEDVTLLLTDEERRVYHMALENNIQVVNQLAEMWGVGVNDIESMNEVLVGPFNLAGEMVQGTIDLVYYTKDYSHIAVGDLKTGEVPVPSPEVNTQLLAYGYLLASKWFDKISPYGSERTEPTTSISSIEFFINQPRTKNPLKLKSVEFTPGEWQNKLEAVVLRWKANKDQPLTLGNTCYSTKGCAYCKNAGNCPALVKLAQSISYEYFSAENLPEKLSSLSFEDMLNKPEEVATLLRLRKLMTLFCDSVQEVAKEMIGSGIDIPGFENSPRRGKPVIDRENFLIHLGNAGWDAYKILEFVKNFPVSDILKRLLEEKEKSGEVGPFPTKKAEKEALNNMYSELLKAGVFKEVPTTNVLMEVGASRKKVELIK